FGSYTVNDIAQSELDLAPSYVEKACFDIAAEDVPQNRQYDLMFSKLVFEHIKDAKRAWNNTRALLKQGGIALHFCPVLCCPPFIINWLLPERLSRHILRFFFPARNEGEHPKFPA